jgi:hypothetical protein
VLARSLHVAVEVTQGMYDDLIVQMTEAVMNRWEQARSAETRLKLEELAMTVRCPRGHPHGLVQQLEESRRSVCANKRTASRSKNIVRWKRWGALSSTRPNQIRVDNQINDGPTRRRYRDEITGLGFMRFMNSHHLTYQTSATGRQWRREGFISQSDC